MAEWSFDDRLGIAVRYEPTEEQRSVIAAPIDRPIRLVAGAGSGKTETIVSRFLWLVLRKQLDPARILAVTFTEKAAGELERRISEALVRNGAAPPQGRLYIHTFHGLCRRILHQHAYQAGLPGAVNILDEVGSRILLDRIFTMQVDLALAESLTEEDLQDLPFDSTSQLSSTLYKLVEDARGMGWEPEDLDGERTNTILGDAQTRFYSAMERFFFDPPQDGMESLPVFRDCLAAERFPVSHFAEEPVNSSEDRRRKELIKALGYVYNRSLKRYVPGPQLAEIAKTCERVRRGEATVLRAARDIYAEYRKNLYAEGKIDFNELIQRTVRLLTETQEVREQYRNTFQYVLVDEFQDTSRLQARLTDLLCRRHAAVSGPANLMITGDRKQSIYVWRYARPRNLAELVPDEWVLQGHALEFFLSRNFRSTRKIIEVANALGPDLEPADKSLTAHKDADGEVYLASSFHAPKGSRISDARRQEARWAAETIRFLKERSGNPIRYFDVAILLRDRKRAFVLRAELDRLGIPLSEGGAGDLFEEPLVRDVIAYLRVIANPHDDAALCRILERPPVRLSDRQIYLLGTRATASRSDERRADHLFAGLMRRVSGRSDTLSTEAIPLESVEPLVRRLCRWIEQQSILTASAFLTEIARTAGILDLPVAEELRGWRSSYEQLRAMALSLPSSGLDERVDTFVDLLELYQSRESVSLPQSSPQHNSGVQLMTIHQAKGLEFDACFAMGLKQPQSRLAWGLDEDWGLVSGKFFGEETLKSGVLKVFQEQNDEERRIAYVAFTRAKRVLLTSHCSRKEDDFHPYVDYLHDAPQEPGRLDSPDIRCPASPALLRAHDGNRAASFPEHIETSFSALERAQRCPVEYWIDRYWDLPEWFGDTSRSEQADYGRLTGEVFHNMVADYYTSRWSGRCFDAEDRFENLLRTDRGHAPESLYEKIKALWIAFMHSEWAARSPAPWDVERPVRWTLRLNDEILVTVKGRIDLIDHDCTGNPAIKDFKTKTSLTDNDLDIYAIQGLLYARSLGLREDSIPVSPAVIHVTGDGVQEVPLAERMHRAADVLAERIEALVQVEIAIQVPEKPSHVLCGHCGYARICPRG